jgi:predicted transcriptional regulator
MGTLKKIGKIILEKYGTRFFTLDKIVEAGGMERIPARRALERLRRDGLVWMVEKYPPERHTLQKGRPAIRITYRLANREKLQARVAPRLKEDSAVQRMWVVIRYKRIFTRRDLIVLAGASRENAKWYTKRLRDAGIIKATRAGGRGVEWVMVKDVGAKRQ